MDADRYDTIGRIFHAVLDMPPEGRAGAVRALCSGDDQLRREVESLLAAQQEAGPFIEGAALEMVAELVAADEAATSPPARIGHYDVISLIARGGMGAVYEGRDPALGRRVALKVPRRALTADLEALDRFEIEARAASSLNHPNIVTIYEIGEFGEGRFIAMELVDGRSLAEMIGQPVPPLLVARIGRQLAQALAVAHQAGIVHGDIKPANIMLRPDGYLKVLDFGLARLLTGGAGDGTNTPGHRLGTPRYMSPEQARGEAASSASDVFAFGLVLFELAAGRHPFPDDGPTDVPPTVSSVAPTTAPDGEPLLAALDPILRRMLEPDPGARPAARDVEAVLKSLDAAWSARVDRRDRTHALPAQRTPFIGRSAELADLESLLRDQETRLVTLTGPAGTGKTRLALQVAARMTDHFAGGVSFVNLAPLSDAALVAGAVAQAHGLREVPGRPLVDVLREHLRERGPTLLLMDNFEQVADAASLVQELLDACPSLLVLVTSRLVLHVYGEHEFPVPPLPLPESGGQVERLMTCPSVALFVQRAASVARDFTLTDRNAAAVVDICRRLDGLPLAIELAAARVKILAPAELLARLEHRLDLPGGEAPDRPARQQTLRRAIDWSYYLLSPAEQILFRRLSVFVGGATLEAIEAVCNAAEDLETDVLRAVAGLVDNSLLFARTAGGEASRFLMLETIREYARERLDESGEGAATRRAHAAYVLVVAEEESAEATAAEREAWLLWCDREHDNIRSAIQCLVSTGDAEWGVRLGAALLRFWEQREHLTEGREAFAALLGIPSSGPPSRARARALYHAGMLADTQGDHDAAQAAAHQARSIFLALGDTAGVASTTQTLAWQAQLRGRHAQAIAMLEQAASLWDQIGDAAAGDMARSNMAAVAKADGQYRLARALCEQLVTSAAQRSDPRAMASALNELGELAAAGGDAALARRYHHESLAMFRQIDDGWGVARVLTDLANVDAAESDFAAAERALTEALRIARALGHQRGVARRLELLSGCAARQERHAAAVRLASAAARIRQRIGVRIESADQQKIDAILADARRLLGGDGFETAWARGQVMTVDDLLESARDPRG